MSDARTPDTTASTIPTNPSEVEMPYAMSPTVVEVDGSVNP